MAKVTVRNEGISFEVPDGARFLEYAKRLSSMPFGCENGKCGTCICTIMKGMDHLNPQKHDEWMLLQKRGALPSQRLACQVWVKQGEVEMEY